jgi:hypothetical protein
MNITNGNHTINGLTYSLSRNDFTAPAGEVEIWQFQNQNGMHHPMHCHGAFFVSSPGMDQAISSLLTMDCVTPSWFTPMKQSEWQSPLETGEANTSCTAIISSMNTT